MKKFIDFDIEFINIVFMLGVQYEGISVMNELSSLFINVLNILLVMIVRIIPVKYISRINNDCLKPEK